MEKFLNKSKNAGGFLLIEIALAMAIFGVFVTTISIFLANSSLFVAEEIKHQEALYLTKSVLEKTLAFETPQIATTSYLVAQSTITAITPCLFLAKTETKWSSHGSHIFSLQTVFASSSLVHAHGNDCGGYSNLNLFSQISTTTTIINISSIGTNAFDVFNSSVYMTSSDNFLTAIDRFGAPHRWNLSSTSVNSLDAISGYVFAATTGSSSQFRIFQTSPTFVEIASSSLPQVSGSYPAGLSVVYSDGKVYIGTHRTAGNEFHVFDVHDPVHPIWLGSIELNHNINTIAIENHYAYLATSGNTSDIIILDISNPHSITKIASLAFTGNEDTLCLTVLGSFLYAGRTKGLHTSDPEFVTVDIHDPAHPQIIGSMYLGTTIHALKAEGSAVVAATDIGTYIISLENPTLPQAKKTSASPSVNIDYEDNHIYILHNTSLEIMTSV